MGKIKHGHQWEAWDGESRWPDKQEQLQTLMPIRWRANVWGTKERKTQTLLCVPRLATRPILLAFRTPALKCKYGSAELVYLGQVIYTMLSIRERTHGACWLVLKALGLAINLVLTTSGATGQWKPCLILTTRTPAYAQSRHPLLRSHHWTAAASRPSSRLRVWLQPFRQPAGLKVWNEWLLAKVQVLPACAHERKNLVINAALIFGLVSILMTQATLMLPPQSRAMLSLNGQNGKKHIEKHGK